MSRRRVRQTEILFSLVGKCGVRQNAAVPIGDKARIDAGRARALDIFEPLVQHKLPHLPEILHLEEIDSLYRRLHCARERQHISSTGLFADCVCDFSVRRQERQNL